MLSTTDLVEKLAINKFPAFRAKQLLQAICKGGIDDYEKISTLPKELKTFLKTEIPIFSIKPIRKMISKDNCTHKVLFELKDSLKVEAVLMKFKDGRNSVCISSQAGCQLGCKFCATGTMKFGRNLTYEEISDQVLYFAHYLFSQGEHVTNIIYMGMGEPFMNYENVVKSLKVINDKQGLNIGARHITVSTSGIVEGIEKLADEDMQVNLAISLHAPNQTLREKIMPIARKYSLEKLMEGANDYLTKTNRRISYEYVMLKGINDSIENAQELGDLLKGQLCHVNLIPYNATGIKGIEGTFPEVIIAFRNVLKDKGIPVTIRVTMGEDIAAACGQLANKEKITT